MGVSFHDGSPLPKLRLSEGILEMNTEVVMKTSGRQSIYFNRSEPVNGIWTLQVDLRNQLGTWFKHIIGFNPFFLVAGIHSHCFAVQV